MRTPEQDEKIKEYEEDITDAKIAFLQAIDEFKIAQDWLNKMRSYYAESIIRLDDYKKKYEPPHRPQV